MLVASGLLGLAAAIVFVFTPPRSHFMDEVLSFIFMFVGMWGVAAIVIFSVLGIFTIVIQMLSSDN